MKPLDLVRRIVVGSTLLAAGCGGPGFKVDLPSKTSHLENGNTEFPSELGLQEEKTESPLKQKIRAERAKYDKAKRTEYEAQETIRISQIDTELSPLVDAFINNFETNALKTVREDERCLTLDISKYNIFVGYDTYNPESDTDGDLSRLSKIPSLKRLISFVQSQGFPIYAWRDTDKSYCSRVAIQLD